MTEQELTLEEAEKRVDEIAEVLAARAREGLIPKGDDVIELRKLCGKHRIIPTTYILEGVDREGRLPQCHSQVTEIWKGVWNDKPVALKVLRLPRDDHNLQRTKSRFCKEVALMKQLDHKNILPFHGVLITASEFCLVFPWYENGNIVDYLEKNQKIKQFKLLLGAVDGLCFLHNINLAHGSVRAAHMLVDDDGAARLATGSRTIAIILTGYRTLVDHENFGVGDNPSSPRYRAPELNWPEEYGMKKTDKVTATKESDVYETAMATYEVLTGKIPYFKCHDTAALEKIRIGEPPQKPLGIDEGVWEFLRKCWNRNPKERPSTTEIREAFLQFCSLPRFAFDPNDPLATELPGKVKLQILSIRVGLEKSKQQQFCVKLRYGNMDYTTPPAKFADASGEHGWAIPESWSFETNKQHHGQSISLELLLRTSIFKKDRVCATGSFSLTGNVNKQTNVKLEAQDGAGSAVLKVFLIEM